MVKRKALVTLQGQQKAAKVDFADDITADVNETSFMAAVERKFKEMGSDVHEQYLSVVKDSAARELQVYDADFDDWANWTTAGTDLTPDQECVLKLRTAKCGSTAAAAVPARSRGAAAKKSNTACSVFRSLPVLWNNTEHVGQVTFSTRAHRMSKATGAT